MIDYKLIAKGSSIFRGLSEEEKNSLLRDGKLRHFNKKEFLFHHGDKLMSLFIICSGTVKISRSSSEGKEKTLNVLTAQNIICDSRIYESKTVHQYNAVSVTDVVLLEFSKDWLRENVKSKGEFALNLLLELSLQNQRIELEAEHKASMSVAQSLACFLQELCLAFKLDPKGFELPYSKKLIASRLGIENETLSRALPKLESYGIKVEGSHVIINSFEMIEDKVCSSCSIEGDCSIHENLKRQF